MNTFYITKVTVVPSSDGVVEWGKWATFFLTLRKESQVHVCMNNTTKMTTLNLQVQ